VSITVLTSQLPLLLHVLCKCRFPLFEFVLFEIQSNEDGPISAVVNIHLEILGILFLFSLHQHSVDAPFVQKFVATVDIFVYSSQYSSYHFIVFHN